MTRVHVADLDAFGPGAKRIVETERGEVGVFNVDGELYAIANVCAHEGGPLCEGTVLDDVRAEFTGVGERVVERFVEGEKVIKCPWHGWEYYLASGDLAGHGQLSLPTFEVTVDDGDVYVEV